VHVAVARGFVCRRQQQQAVADHQQSQQQQPDGMPPANTSQPPPPHVNGFSVPPPPIQNGTTDNHSIPPPPLGEHHPSPCHMLNTQAVPPPTAMPPVLSQPPIVEDHAPMHDDQLVPSFNHPNGGATTYGPLEPDMFGFYSVSFVNRSKDLTDRRVRQDFGKFSGGADVSRVHGNFGSTATDNVITVSFSDKSSADLALQNAASKYSDVAVAPCIEATPDKDGYYSIEFTNAGMHGIREITNEFSQHGEVVKVMQGGAKNAIKKVTVSYAEAAAAVAAVKCYINSKDFVGVDLTRECLTNSS